MNRPTIALLLALAFCAISTSTAIAGGAGGGYPGCGQECAQTAAIVAPSGFYKYFKAQHDRMRQMCLTAKQVGPGIYRYDSRQLARFNRAKTRLDKRLRRRGLATSPTPTEFNSHPFQTKTGKLVYTDCSSG